MSKKLLYFIAIILVLTCTWIIVRCYKGTALSSMYSASSTSTSTTIYTTSTTTTSTTTTTTTTTATDGFALGWIGGGINGWKTSGSVYLSDELQNFNLPKSLFVDTTGIIYVADTVNNRVSKWESSSGNALGWIGGGSDGWQTTSGALGGKDFRSFRGAMDVFVDGTSIYVVDGENERVCKWDINGNAVGWIGNRADGWKTNDTFGHEYSDYQSFYSPSGLYVYDGTIYVTDTNNHRICKWDIGGTALGWIGGGSDSWKTSDGTTSGYDYQSFSEPTGVYVDGSFIYVADYKNHRISKWTVGGTAIGWIGGGSNGWQTGISNATNVYNGFSNPADIFVDGSGTIFVADSVNHRISKWTADGTAIGWIGGGGDGWKVTDDSFGGAGYQNFSWPMGITIDLSGNIFIADKINHRISKWQN